MEKSLLFLFCGVNLLLLNGTSEAAPNKLITIYGLEQASNLSEGSQAGINYVLQAASFNNHAYAVNYKNKIASRTDAEVRIVHSEGHYRVLLGPFETAHELAQVSRQLLSKNAYAPARPTYQPSVVHQPVVNQPIDNQLSEKTATISASELKSSSSIRVFAKAQENNLTLPDPQSLEKIQPLQVKLAINDVNLTPPGDSEIVALNDASATTTTTEESPLAKIQLLRKNNQLDAAKDLATTHMQKHPDDMDVLLLLGLIYNQQGEYTKAESTFKQVLSKEPDNVDARVGLINVKIVQKQYQPALDLANEGLEITPDEPRLLYVRNNIGNVASTNSTLSQIQALRRDNQLDAAKNMANNHLQAHPDDIDVILVLGSIYSQEHNYAQAETYFNRVIAKEPTYVDARIGLINAKVAQKQYQAALDIANEGLRLTPNDSKLLAAKKNIEKRQMTDTSKPVETTTNQDSNTPTSTSTTSGTPVQSSDSSSTTSSGTSTSITASTASETTHESTPSRNYYSESKPASNPRPKQVAARRVYHRPTTTTVSSNVVKQAKNYLDANQYQLAKQILINRLRVNPGDTDARIALADVYLSRYHDLTALYTINQGLLITPNNAKLYVKKGEIETILYRHALAANAYQHALAADPQNKNARSLLDEVMGISPRYGYGLNEVGITTDNAYVSDLEKVWDYSGIYYSRDTDLGRFTGAVNYAQRQGFNAPQYSLEWLTRVNRFVYLDFLTAASDQPALFPKFLGTGEAYVNIPNFLEISAGAKYATLGKTFFTTYTGSLTRYAGNYMFTFRPFYFTPKDKNNSVLYTGLIRKYFETDDHYIGVNFGAGKSPDLADLLTVNFIVIKNSFLGVNYQFPILNHKFVVDLGAGYQRWQYPSGLVRKLYDGSVGLKYRF